jgi:large subunit ribosomal protein L1
VIIMNKQEVLLALENIKKESPKRKFGQSVDLIVALKDLDFKKAEQQVDFFVTLHHDTGKKRKVCAFVGAELIDEAKTSVDLSITLDEFAAYTKQKAKKLANEYDFFIAQATIMTKVAATFGRYLGVRGKMPNPKAGCVVPPKGAGLKALHERLQKTVKVTARKIPIIQLRVGTENMKDEDVADNIIYVYDQLIHHLPGERNNIKAIYIKLTMGKPAKLEK